MTSSVYFKFKSSKEPQRIVFDGTGISVFELKREIIAASGLGDGTDFDLMIYPEDDTKYENEYKDDTEIISRSSHVVARRLPASRPGAGRAARYVSGAAPVRAIKDFKSNAAKATPTPSTAPSTAQTEEERELAFLQESESAWEQQKDTMSHAKPVFHKKKPMNVPDHPPPVGYVCYRCGDKGHWIQACPTNDDPNFKSKPRIKRTTGIPRSFLKVVEKPTGEDGEDTRGVMVNAEGEYVIAEPDQKTWEKFRETAQASAAQAQAVATDNKEIQERGLECPIDKQMFDSPVKTPCCGKTYCYKCIDDALIENDLVCPNCSKKDVSVEDVTPDKEMEEKIKAYESEKAKEKSAKEQQAKEEAATANSPKTPSNDIPSVSSTEKGKSNESNENADSSKPPEANGVAVKVNSPLSVAANPAGPGSPESTNSSPNPKKRAATEELENDRKPMPPTAPKAMRQQQNQQPNPQQNPQDDKLQKFTHDMEALKNMPMNMPPTSMGMSMGMGMNPNMGMMNPMNQNQWNNFNGYPNNMYGNMGYNNMNMNGTMNPMAMNGMGGMNGMNGYNNYGGWQNQGGYNNMNGGNFSNGNYPNNYQNNFNNQMNTSSAAFPNQQRTVFADPLNGDNDAYFRKPVNPQRHQHRNRRARQPDYQQVNQMHQM